MNRTQRKTRKDAGFVISLEFLLVLALVVVPLMLGFILLGRKVVTLYLNYIAAIEQPMSRAVVWDSSDNPGTLLVNENKPVGPVIGWDQFEAPQVMYRDKSAPYNVGNFQPGVLLGVRPYRFTTKSKVYYTGLDCTGDAYIRAAATRHYEVGFLSQMQGVNYAVGTGNLLYREGGTPFAGTLQSVWTSQYNADGDDSPAVGGPSCENLTITATYTLYGLAALGRDGLGTATATYGSCVPCTPAPHNLAPGTYTATITYSGSQVAQFAPYVGTFTITVISATQFTYPVPGVLDAAPSGQLQYVTTTISGFGADFVNALLVADLDGASNFAPNYWTAFRTTP